MAAESRAAGSGRALSLDRLVPFTEDLHHEVVQFLVVEAAMLDEQRYEEWLDLMADDVVYRMPVRATTPGAVTESVLAGMDHFLEDLHSLRKRVERLRTEYAWTEDPPSRVRHFVSNVRVYRLDGDEVLAKSAFLLFRSRGDARPPELVAGERADRLRPRAGGWSIARRDILVDESVLRTQNLAIFL